MCSLQVSGGHSRGLGLVACAMTASRLGARCMGAMLRPLLPAPRAGAAARSLLPPLLEARRAAKCVCDAIVADLRAIACCLMHPLPRSLVAATRNRIQAHAAVYTVHLLWSCCPQITRWCTRGFTRCAGYALNAPILLQDHCLTGPSKDSMQVEGSARGLQICLTSKTHLYSSAL